MVVHQILLVEISASRLREGQPGSAVIRTTIRRLARMSRTISRVRQDRENNRDHDKKDKQLHTRHEVKGSPWD
jgi:translation initiation factor 2B subunit (eIF-2B alpha/beta/delta family)